MEAKKSWKSEFDDMELENSEDVKNFIHRVEADARADERKKVETEVAATAETATAEA